jgi:FkbM family methyltransferase
MHRGDQNRPLSTWILGKLNGVVETWRFDNRWQLLVEELIAGKTLRVYRLNGIDVLADHRTGDHQGGVRGVLASNEYRQLLDKIPLDSVHTVVDLGAHVGGFMLLLKTLNAPLERVLCVEPNPISRVKLLFNLQHNRIAAEIFAGAISDNRGTAKLHVGSASTGFSLLPNHPNLDGGAMEVETMTLDMLVDHYLPEATIDICKMDVEGAEFEILLGEHAQTLAKCRFLICEIHSVSGYGRSALIDAICRKGFVLVPVAKRATTDTVLFRHEKEELHIQS